MNPLQAEIRSWHEAKYPDATEEDVILKFAEEAGELVQATNVYRLNHTSRDTIGDAVRFEALLEEFGDVVVTLMGLANHYGFDFNHAVEQRWQEVRTR